MVKDRTGGQRLMQIARSATGSRVTGVASQTRRRSPTGPLARWISGLRCSHALTLDATTPNTKIGQMPKEDQLFYSSENGDDWLLVNGDSKDALVRHRPNVSSGGQSRDVALGDFLAHEQNTPQGQALRRVMETQGP